MKCNSPDKNFKPGTLVEFIYAPPRWARDNVRDPEFGLLGKQAIIISGPHFGAHDWGGAFKVLLVSTEGVQTDSAAISHYGDFMKEVLPR